MQEIKIFNTTDSTIIDIEGTIGVPEEWQFENPQHRVATYEKFRLAVEQIEQLQSSEVVVNIRSTGGDVNDALLIYEALKSLNATITTRCYGYVASAATVIAQAASEGLREISATSLYLVHNTSCAAEGNADELLRHIELLRKSDERIAELYATRSGGDVATFSELMAAESGAGRWLSAQEVIDLSLADRLIEDDRSESVPEEQPVIEEGAEASNGLVRALHSVQSIVRRIGERLGSTEAQVDIQQIATPSPSRHSVTHLDDLGLSNSGVAQSSTIVFDEEQRELRRSAVKSVDDPSIAEVTRSANERAYDFDAQRLRRM